tara:strand:+ start:2927 stop:3055 length:129 start_codon:yes stop_codon:yes gene_type:complete
MCSCSAGRREYLNTSRRNGDLLMWETATMNANAQVYGDRAYY